MKFLALIFVISVMWLGNSSIILQLDALFGVDFDDLIAKINGAITYHGSNLILLPGNFIAFH